MTSAGDGGGGGGGKSLFVDKVSYQVIFLKNRIQSVFKFTKRNINRHNVKTLLEKDHSLERFGILELRNPVTKPSYAK